MAINARGVPLQTREHKSLRLRRWRYRWSMGVQQGQKSGPRMSVFCPVASRQRRFRPYHALIPADNPTSDTEAVPGGNATAKSNPEFGRERFRPGSRHSLGHCFIENRADNAPMDDPAEAFPGGSWSPGSGHFSVGLTLEPYPQSVQVVLPANKTARLRAGAQWPS